MNKVSVLGLICICTLAFLLIQILMYGSLDSWTVAIPLKKMNFLSRGKDDLWNAVKDFNEICESLRLELILIDTSILKHLAERIQDYTKRGIVHSDTHGRCHYFCSREITTFAMMSSSLAEKKLMESLLEITGKKNFKVLILDGLDSRQQSLETNINTKNIPYHIIIQRGSATIHIVLFYERLNQYWASKCQSTEHRISNINYRALERSQFCIQQNILKRFAWTTSRMDKLLLKIPKHVLNFLHDVENSKFLPCSMERARQFYSKYGTDRSTEADVFRLKAKNLLSTVKYVLDTFRVPFWLSSGTCLGWFRQCDFIPHSKDLDIGIWIKDYNQKITQELKNAGLVPKHIFGKVEDSFELSFRTPSNDLKLDIFFFYEENDHMWNGGTQAKSGKKFKYRFPKFDLCWTEFAELLVRVPCDTLTYIQANYGRSWNLLIKEWDWKKSPSNVEENGVWPENELSKVVQVFQ